jgi:hypothetical protein
MICIAYNRFTSDAIPLRCPVRVETGRTGLGGFLPVRSRPGMPGSGHSAREWHKILAADGCRGGNWIVRVVTGHLEIRDKYLLTRLRLADLSTEQDEEPGGRRQ